MAYREPSSINSVSIALLLIVVFMCYGAIKYLPVYWERERMAETLAGFATAYPRMDEREFRRELVEVLEDDYGLRPEPEDIEISRRGNWVTITVYYSVVVEHPFDRNHEIYLDVAVNRRVFHR